ncbi:HAD family hydrolase [Pseudoroseicyclus tamaricis]|uniref:phosphoglycolate phosphatase n=1 Tax=Pseudoroseicyclus tamaricis TaxID=2705421 RepID=A0A6B2JGT5_9RHOB|nr:HAD family hydrolase [Pseudoroseicyclus tamaricis]NDV00421.1 HAD family hydrolase [Pseudoroseicyclus tamaricis]
MTVSPPPLRGILLDKDGTIFDFTATWGAWTAGFCARLAGGDAARTAAIADAMGYDPEAQRFRPGSPVVAGTAEEVAAVIAPHLAEPMSDAALVALIQDAGKDVPQVPVAPLGPLLQRLGAGHVLGLVTNDAEATARAHLVAAGIEGAFAFIAGYDSGHGAKPEPGQLLAFAAATGLAPGEVLMVGDSTHDLLAARAAGMRAVGVLTGTAPAEELAPHAEAVLASLADLPGWLDQGA